MTTKLTLRLDDELIKQAKKTAQSKGVSLSRIVEDYFRSLMIWKEKATPETLVLSEISGVLSARAGATRHREEYRKHLEEKYR
jgi:antitoxin component of RelBE/YafQ-DinJ toxin-antitoxin module